MWECLEATAALAKKPQATQAATNTRLLFLFYLFIFLTASRNNTGTRIVHHKHQNIGLSGAKQWYTGSGPAAANTSPSGKDIAVTPEPVKTSEPKPRP